MKKERKHSIDKLFLESLSGNQIEPTVGVWESLSAYIPSSGGRGVFMYLISGVLIGAFVFFMHTGLPGGSDQLADQEQLIIEESPDAGESHSQALAQNSSLNEDQSNEDPIIEETENIQPNLSNSTSSSLGYTPPASSITEESKSIIAITQIEPETDAGDFSNDRTPTYQYLTKAKLRSNQIETNSKMGIGDAQGRDNPDPIFNLNVKDSYVRKADVLFGAGFSPAVNIYPEGQNRNDYSLELIAAYEKSRFIVESGLGVNYTTESAKYKINYSSYDSVGYYVGVNSFTVDPVNPDSVIFETSLKNLYDSVDHYQIRENTNKYVYLQIPLKVGYRVVQARRFSLDLKLGLLFSLQVYKDVPGIPYQGNDQDQIEVLRQYPERLTTTWQYTAGVGINYQINNQLRFSLEPFYRQYIKSVYSPASGFPAKSPYSFGIRGGLYFHF